MRKPIIAGNWKMYKTVTQAIELANGLTRELCDIDAIDIVLCPAFTALSEVYEVITGTSLQLAAQDMYWEGEGAFTGEVSPVMLKDVGCSYCIVGHSERRQFFGETNQTVNNKIKAALRYDLIPIVCVGENLSERESGKTFEVVRNHVTGSFAGITRDEVLRTVLAYEPVWAIGTGKTATPAQAQEVHAYIRSVLAEMFSKEVAMRLRIQYGGSVKPENIKELMAQPDIDGGLVGGASLKVESFAQIVRNALEGKR